MDKVNLTAASHTVSVQYKTNNAAGNTEAFMRNVALTYIRLNTAESYSGSDHATIDDDFAGGQTHVYAWAHGLEASGSYKVGYYDAGASGGQLVGTDASLTATSLGNLSSTYQLNTQTSATSGTWHGVVYRSTATPSQNYNDAAATTGYVVADSFEVQAAAIPEFPTVFAAVGSAGLCFAAYWWMRRKAARTHGVC